MPAYDTQSKIKVAVILGTRPEIIKLAPVISALKASARLEPVVIATGQHKEMAKQAFDIFGIKPDIDLQLMKPNQTPNSLLSDLVKSLDQTLSNVKPAGILVQGDTTTAMGSGLTAFHLRIPIGHVEAGLRTYNLFSPFPEEMNRTVLSRIAHIHFCPTQANADNLKKEGVNSEIHVVGNTVVDSLKYINSKLENQVIAIEDSVANLQLANKKLILVTGHRRENFDQPLVNLCHALIRLTEEIKDLEIVYPVHRNPNVSGPVEKILGSKPRIHLLTPVDYPSLIYLMKRSALIISDSGGIQEEAPVFGKHVLITRNTTERQEAVEAGTATLTSLDDPEKLLSTAKTLLEKDSSHSSISPFGDGRSSIRIVNILEQRWD